VPPKYVDTACEVRNGDTLEIENITV